MGKYFDHDKIFPIIAKCISKEYQRKRKKDWVYHEEIVRALLNDSTGKKLVENAYLKWLGSEERKESRMRELFRGTREGWASNMVAFFGERITKNLSPYKAQFDRTETKPYAYKPKRNE